MGLVACLWRDLSPTTATEAPREPRHLEIMVEPAIAIMCASCIIQAETMGVMYMDMVTNSVGRVALSSSHVATCPPGPTIEDITNLP